MSIIVDVDHEDGTLSEYTGTVEDSGDLSVTAGAALAGTGYGLSAFADDTVAIYGYSTFDKVAQIRVRFYFDPNGVGMNNASYVTIGLLRQTTGSFLSIAYVNLRYYTATGFQLIFAHKDDAYANAIWDTYNVTDAPHYVEFHIVRATTDVSADGTVEWWVDGVSQGSASNVDNYNIMSDTATWQWRLGLAADVPAGINGTVYFDQLVINDDGGAIGPVISGASASVPTNQGLVTRGLRVN